MGIVKKLTTDASVYKLSRERKSDASMHVNRCRLAESDACESLKALVCEKLKGHVNERDYVCNNMCVPLANPRDAIYFIHILLMTRKIVYYSIWHCILLRLKHQCDTNGTSISTYY